MTALAAAGACALTVGSAVPAADAGLRLLATDPQSPAHASGSDVLRELIALANGGDGVAQLAVAKMYHVGPNGRPDLHQAIRWYRVAADHGEAEAEFQLGMIYLNGQGVTECEETALRWLGRAADGGHSEAATLYEYLLHNESGVGC